MAFLAACACLLPLEMRAQQPAGGQQPDMPVRRALPVNPDDAATPAPATEPPTPPAVPFDFDHPGREVPRARPVATPTPEFRPAASPAPVAVATPIPEPASPDDIRVAPNTELG